MRQTQLDSGIIRFDSEVSGSHVVIFAAEHGDEREPVYGLGRLFFGLKSGGITLSRGSLTLVLVANVEAWKQNKRYIRHNLNRLYRTTYDSRIEQTSYEYKRAQQLKPLIEESDYFIALHAAPIADGPFLIVEKQYADAFAPMGISRIITGWSSQDGDTAGDSESYANKHGSMACTLECGDLNSEASARVAYESVLRMLEAWNMIERSREAKPAGAPVEEFHIYRTIEKRSRDFQWAIEPKNFLFLPRDTIIAWQLGSVAVMAEEDSYMVIPSPEDKQQVGEYMCFLARKV